MKAITLTQPWATLVAIGAKRFETRSWTTSYRGPLAIHAAKGFPREAQLLCAQEPFRAALKNNLPEFSPQYAADALPRSAVIAVARLVAIVQVNETTLRDGAWIETAWPHHITLPPEGIERYFGDYSMGRYVWITEDLERFPDPIPAKGALGLWEWTPPDSCKLLLASYEEPHGAR